MESALVPRTNNAARPPVRKQLHPRALAIIDAIEPIPEGYTAEGVPRWRGFSAAAWETLAQDEPAILELVSICRVHYPTAAAVLLKVRSKRSGGLIPFIFNRSQVVWWNKVAALVAAGLDLFIAILKARQLGMSTIVLGWEWWNLWRLQDSEVLMVGHQKRLAEAHIDTMRLFHEELPNIAGIKPTLRSNSATGRVPKHEVYYSDRRTKGVTVIAQNIDTRGLAAPNHFYDEAAYYENDGGFGKILRTLMPMLPPLGSPARKRASIFALSTANGKNSYYQFWKLAKSGKSDWHPIFIPWTVAEDEYALVPPEGFKLSRSQEKLRKELSVFRRAVDGRDVTVAQMYWRECEMANQGWDEDFFEQEFPGDDETCFLLQTHSVFGRSIRYLAHSVHVSEDAVPAEFEKRLIPCDPKAKIVRGELTFPAGPGPFDRKIPARLEPALEIRRGGRLALWSPPQVNHVYAMGIKTGDGLGRPSCGWVLDVTEGAQVAEWYDTETDLEPFADDMAALGYWYNTATLYPEISNIGRVVMKRLRRTWRYPRVGLEEKWDEPTLRQGKFGFLMTDELREELVRRLVWFVTERAIRIASEGTLEEMSTYQEEDGDYGPVEGASDARVMAAGLACMVVMQTPKLRVLVKKQTEPPSAYDLGLSPFEPPPQAFISPDLDDKWREMPADIRKVVEAGRKRLTLIPTNPIRERG